MTEFTPRTFEVAVTERALNSSVMLMRLTGKSYAQICKDGIDRAATLDGTIQVPEEWLMEDKASRSTLMRLPIDTQQSLDVLSVNAGVSWDVMASLLTECEVYKELIDLTTH